MEMMTVLGICNDGLCMRCRGSQRKKAVIDGGSGNAAENIDGGKITYYTPPSSWGRTLTMCSCISTSSGTSPFPMGWGT